ncbi:ffa9d720-6d1a-4006-8778-d8841bda6793 [Thermothielavioides terrestris]|uniref:Ffa9d720-6d1a-4006-8778-d8841bda6793 n=1 Tax=Thermothielavioides terrestris TaxID=2587410 RepID=A0A3S4F566_9PEZI|nr:ffa9d720-6d1a-4006-8778-d8841bda6793 [Thermothielavioides terrestris]
MDTASHQARRRRGAGAGLRLPNFALIATVFAHPSLFSPTAAAAVDIAPRLMLPAALHDDPSGQMHALHRRSQGEHVVLADCRDQNGVVSSQMAYFSGDPGPSPQDVAVVATAKGQAALWVNTNTSALFPDTDTTFTATLGPRVEDGQFAGTGNNGYGNFSCYQKYVSQLYTYDNTVCSQVYVCDHSTPPPPASADSSGGGMSRGTVIGIAVGVVGGLLFLVAAGLVIWFLRRSRRARRPPNMARSDGWPDGRPPESLPLATVSTEPTAVADEESQSPGRPVMKQKSALYEVDGRWYRAELTNDNNGFEMDAAGHGSAELDSHKPLPSTETREAFQATPALPTRQL